MYQKALAIEETLGRKEGMARQYSNLGVLYETRQESLIERGRCTRRHWPSTRRSGIKKGIASDYCNLGNLYQTRGELDRAEVMSQEVTGH